MQMGPGSYVAMWPFSHSVASCSSDSDSNRNSVRSSSGRHFSPMSGILLRLGQVAMHQHHGHRTFADGRRDTLRGLGAHITCNKHTGHTCFQMVRRSVESPAADVLEVGSGEDETVVVTCDDAVEPFGAWDRPDEAAQPPAVDPLAHPGLPVLQPETRKVPVLAAGVDDLGTRPDLDLGVVLDLLDQVVGHRGLQ